MVPLISETFSLLLLPWWRLVHAALAMHAILAALGTIFKAASALCTYEPRRPRDELEVVPCGPRSDTRLFPASGTQLRSAYIRPVPTYNKRTFLCFEVQTVLVFLRHVKLSLKKRSTGSPRRFRSCLEERAPARRESAGFPLSAPMPTHPRRDPGPKRPWAARPRTPH